MVVSQPGRAGLNYDGQNGNARTCVRFVSQPRRAGLNYDIVVYAFPTSSASSVSLPGRTGLNYDSP